MYLNKAMCAKKDDSKRLDLMLNNLTLRQSFSQQFNCTIFYTLSVLKKSLPSARTYN